MIYEILDILEARDALREHTDDIVFDLDQSISWMDVPISHYVCQTCDRDLYYAVHDDDMKPCPRCLSVPRVLIASVSILLQCESVIYREYDY